jgi:hypothetical protein
MQRLYNWNILSGHFTWPVALMVTREIRFTCRQSFILRSLRPRVLIP